MDPASPPVLRLAPPTGGWRLRIFTTRMVIFLAMQAHLPDEVGAFAASVITGDRSGMGQGSLSALYASNRAHLLSVSELRMGLLTGSIFVIVRTGFAASEIDRSRLRPDSRGGIPDAVGRQCRDRVGLYHGRRHAGRRLAGPPRADPAGCGAGCDPGAGPGFQMSFAATTALVVVFRPLRGVTLWPRWFRTVASVIMSSAVAGVPTSPFAAAHFN
jgi:competence protein ComEC